MSDTLPARPRLVAEDFIALRSLARWRWVQGQTIPWKFNRTWKSISFTDESLVAVDRLIVAGLAEETVCCPDCGRPAFQLTLKGMSLLDRVSGAPPTAPALPRRQRTTLQKLLKKMTWKLIAK